MKEVLPAEGVILPVKWGDLGAQMVKAGVIDADKFEGNYGGQNKLSDESKRLLYDSGNGNIKITKENAGVLLNLCGRLASEIKIPFLKRGRCQTKIWRREGLLQQVDGHWLKETQ